METLLIFLAIAAIQMIAAYSKQKKEKAKRTAPVQRSEPAPRESQPIPDPYRELREALGLPPKEEAEQATETEEDETEERKFDGNLENEIPTAEEIAEEKTSGIYNYKQPFQSITDRPSPFESISSSTYIPTVYKDQQTKSPSLYSQHIDISHTEQGILWLAILNEPRFRKKWSRK
ncbi:hypothetical protein AGMMS49938_13970 [Fibrobacterales bacterium]|nr:hypothetical protein AGMMS49938_13970 [Fibrobacterales bacterium]